MKNVLLIAIFAFSTTYVFASSGVTEQRIDLKDGTVLLIKSDGDMKHFDAEGNRLRMRDGKVMVGVDGQKYMMKSDAIWKIIMEKGTLHPNH